MSNTLTPEELKAIERGNLKRQGAMLAVPAIINGLKQGVPSEVKNLIEEFLDAFKFFTERETKLLSHIRSQSEQIAALTEERDSLDIAARAYADSYEEAYVAARREAIEECAEIVETGARFTEADWTKMAAILRSLIGAQSNAVRFTDRPFKQGEQA